MQPQKCSLKLYTNFLIVSQSRYSGLELAKVSPIEDMQHDAVSRWLASSRFTPSELWNQVKGLVNVTTGYLVGDDTLLAKPYSRRNELAKKQYSGDEHRLINGINLVNLLWTDGTKFVPVDYRHYRKEADDKTKNDHFTEMLDKAEKRKFLPLYVLFDSWYSSVKNLKHIARKGWKFICNVKSNRLVSVEKGTYISIQNLDLKENEVKQVWLKEFGFVLVCKIVAADGDITYLITNDLNLINYHRFTNHWQNRWHIEEFHRGLKQTTGIEKCYSTKAASQKTHIFAAFKAFIKLERYKLKHGTSWYERKISLTRLSVTNYLNHSNA